MYQQIAALEGDHDELPVAGNGANTLACDTLRQPREALPHDVIRGELRADNVSAGKFRRNGTDDSFDFGEFRHDQRSASSLSNRRLPGAVSAPKRQPADVVASAKKKAEPLMGISGSR
jgi:hypothetical protein